MDIPISLMESEIIEMCISFIIEICKVLIKCGNFSYIHEHNLCEWEDWKVLQKLIRGGGFEVYSLLQPISCYYQIFVFATLRRKDFKIRYDRYIVPRKS